MEIIAIVGLFLVTAFILVILGMMNASSSSKPAQLSYKKKTALLTGQELRFYRILLIVCEETYLIQTMVRVADVITPVSKKFTKDWRTSFNKIQSKHFDFVLCNPKTFEPIIVIELDDNTHNNPDSKQRDEVKNQACESASLPLLRHKIEAKYDPFELDKKLKDCLKHQK